MTVDGLTVKEHFSQLMDFVSRYSDGEELKLVVKDFKLIYQGSRHAVSWIEDMIEKWSFPLTIPARDEV